MTAVFRYLEVGDRWVRAIRSAYAGDMGAGEALEAAAHDIDRLIQEGA